MSAISSSTAIPSTPSTLFHRSYRSWRTQFSIGLSILAGTLTIVACIPLFSVLAMLIYRGGARILHSGLTIFTALPPGAADPIGTGGFGNAIVGTLVMVGLAVLIAVPFGILAAIFLSEYSPNSRLSTTVRFAAKILTGLPSILAGVFAYAAAVIPDGPFAKAAGFVLSFLHQPAKLLPTRLPGQLLLSPHFMTALPLPAMANIPLSPARSHCRC